MTCVVTALVRAVMVVVLLAAPRVASADWLLTPFAGVTFGGNADFGDVGDFEDNFERRMNFGAALAWMGGGMFGFEVDFGSTPNFFQSTSGSGDFELGDSHVTTLMANAVVGFPGGGTTGKGIRPYVSGGVGLIRANVDGGDFFDEINTNDFGINVGGGLHGFFNDHVGVRGDIRYFRSLEDDEGATGDVDLGISEFDFWRGTVGITFRFGG